MIQKVLVDTSVWVDYFKGVSSGKVATLVALMERDEHICLSPTIVQEVLQGVKTDQQYAKIYDLLFGYVILILDPLKSAVDASQLYRTLRKHGITVRKTTDCLIAQYAITHNIALLHNDSDFDLIAQHSPLQLL